MQNKTKCFILLLVQVFAAVQSAEVICYVDSANPTNISTDDLLNALDHCTHLVYGFATLVPKFFTLSFDGAVEHSIHLSDVANLRKKFPRVKFLLSVGGDRDLSDPKKYMELLEATGEQQLEFIMSSLRLMRFFEFDGLDLAFQFPRNEPSKYFSGAAQFWRRIFRKTIVLDPKAKERKQLFTNFVKNLSSVYKAENKLLTLSVLPNVNASMYLDIPAIIREVNLVVLWAFDFNTPTRNRREANYPAPLMHPPNVENIDDSFNNVNYQVQYWLSQTEKRNKIILGVPAYARTWQMTSKSPRNGLPVVRFAHGPSEMGEDSKIPGLLSWPEVCELIKERRRAVRGSMEYGQYFVHTPQENFTYSSWIAFDGPNVVHFKGLYARAHHLGGMALIELGMDDFGAKCTGTNYPILKFMNGLFQ